MDKTYLFGDAVEDITEHLDIANDIYEAGGNEKEIAKHLRIAKDLTDDLFKIWR